MLMIGPVLVSRFSIPVNHIHLEFEWISCMISFRAFLDHGRSFGVDWWEETWMQDHPDSYNMYGGSVQPLPLPRVLKDMYILPELI